MKTEDTLALLLEHVTKLSASVNVLMTAQAQIISELTKTPSEEVTRTLMAEVQKTAQAAVEQLYEKYPTLLNDDKA